MPSAKKKQHKKIKHEKYLSSISKHKSKVQVQIKLQYLISISSKKDISLNKLREWVRSIWLEQVPPTTLPTLLRVHARPFPY